MEGRTHPTPLARRALLRRLDLAAPGFDSADFLFRTTREALLERLEPMTVNAKVVLDLGCATGAARRSLEKRFPGALVIGCDLSPAMLRVASSRRRLFSKPALICADALQLPLADHSVDVVFANQLLPWIDELPALFPEVQRVLKADGLFAFSSLGPDSLRQLDTAWQRNGPDVHVRRFADMHDVGDAAVAAGLRDPVLDVDRLGVTYADTAALFRDLANTAARNSLAGRRKGLTGKHRWRDFLAGLDAARAGGLIELELEIVYGHCWGADRAAGGREVAIDASRIGHRDSR